MVLCQRLGPAWLAYASLPRWNAGGFFFFFFSVLLSFEEFVIVIEVAAAFEHVKAGVAWKTCYYVSHFVVKSIQCFHLCTAHRIVEEAVHNPSDDEKLSKLAHLAL